MIEKSVTVTLTCLGTALIPHNLAAGHMRTWLYENRLQLVLSHLFGPVIFPLIMPFALLT